MQTSLYLKAVHIIFVVTWFAGLFYLPRLFVYIIEANLKPEPDRSILTRQLNMMASRLMYVITWPSAIITLGMGLALIIDKPFWLQKGFMHVKLTLVFLLYLYHFFLQHILNQLKSGVIKYSSLKMRIWNEVSTILLIAIVFLIVLQDTMSMMWGVVGLFLIMLLLLAGIRIYKKVRKE